MRRVAVAAAVLLAYAPCLVMILSRAGDWGSGWLDWRPLRLVELLALCTVAFELLAAASIVAALVMILLAKRALHSAIAARGWNGERALLILSLGPPLLAATISAFVLPVFLLRALAPALVPFYVVVGRAVARTPGKQERNILAAALVITLIPTALQVALRPASEPWDEVRLYLEQHVARGDEVWLYRNDSALPLDATGVHSFRERGIPGDYPAVGFAGPVRAGSPAVVSVTASHAQAIAANAPSALPVIWLVRRQSKLFDPQDDVPRALGGVRRPGSLRQWGYISVQPYYASAR